MQPLLQHPGHGRTKLALHAEADLTDLRMKLGKRAWPLHRRKRFSAWSSTHWQASATSSWAKGRHAGGPHTGHRQRSGIHAQADRHACDASSIRCFGVRACWYHRVSRSRDTTIATSRAGARRPSTRLEKIESCIGFLQFRTAVEHCASEATRLKTASHQGPLLQSSI